MLELARDGEAAGKELGLKVEIDHLPDPRVESRRALLQRQALQADRPGPASRIFLSDSLLDSLVNIADKYKDRIDTSLFCRR